MNQSIKYLFYPIVILLLGLTSLSVQAAIYKCENDSGKTFYADKPCPVNNTETKLQAVKDPVDGYIPPEYKPDKTDSSQRGIVIGKKVESLGNKNDASNGSDSINGSQDNSSNNLTDSEDSNSSESETANSVTESDKLFNEALKIKSQSSVTGKEAKKLEGLSILEPLGD